MKWSQASPPDRRTRWLGCKGATAADSEGECHGEDSVAGIRRSRLLGCVIVAIASLAISVAI